MAANNFRVEVKDVTADQHTRTTKEIQYRIGMMKGDDAWALFKTERELEEFGASLKKSMKAHKLDMPKLKAASKKVLKTDNARGSRARELDEFFYKLFQVLDSATAHMYAEIRDFCTLDEEGNYLYGPKAKALQAAREKAQAEAEAAAARAKAEAEAAAAAARAEAEAAAARAKAEADAKAAREAAEPKPIMICQAIAAYTARPEKHELSFAAGDMIKILKQSSANWWMGKMGDAIGYVPATYLSVMATMDPESGAEGGSGADGDAGASGEDDAADRCWVCGEAFGTERSCNVKGHDVHADRKTCLAQLPAKLKEEKNKAEKYLTNQMLVSDSKMLDAKLSQMQPGAVKSTGGPSSGHRRATITLDDSNSGGGGAGGAGGLGTSQPTVGGLSMPGMGDGLGAGLPSSMMSGNPALGHLVSPSSARGRSSSVAVDANGRPRLDFVDSSEDLVAAIGSNTPPNASAIASIPEHSSFDSGSAIGSAANADGAGASAPAEPVCILDQPDVYERKLFAGSYVLDLNEPQDAEVSVFIQNERVIGGELAGLVAQVLETEDADFVTDFLYVHSSFISSDELLRALMYQIAPFSVPDHKPAAPVHAEGPPAQYAENALYVLTVWVADHFPDFKKQEGLMDLLVRFHVTALLGSTTVTSEGKQAFSRTLADVQNAPLRGIDIFAPKWTLPPGETNKVVWDKLDVTTFAEQLTLLEYEIFATIEPRELLSGKWGKADTAGVAVHVTRLIELFNILSRWVVAEILKVSKVKKRAEVIVRFINLAEQFMMLKNFNGVLEIVSGLGASEIHRLKKTWAKVPEDKVQVLGHLRILTGRDRNFKFMRDKLLTTSLPCLPYMGLFLTDLTFIIDGNKSKIRDNVINYSKWLHCAKVLKQMRTYQEAPYDIEKDHYVAYFIENCLPEGGIEEAEAYELSLKLEPRK